MIIYHDKLSICEQLCYQFYAEDVMLDFLLFRLFSQVESYLANADSYFLNFLLNLTMKS